MDEVFTRLSSLLDDEAERQENVLALCRAQGEAARKHDIPAMEARTRALTLLLREGIEAGVTRHALLERLTETYELAESSRNLTGIIDAAPEPWTSRLREQQRRIRGALAETQAVVRVNNQIMRRSLGIVQGALQTLWACLPAGYDDRGERVGAGRHAARLNQRA